MAGGDPSDEQNAIDDPMHIRQGAGQLKRERSEVDHGFTNDVAAVHHHERYSFQEYDLHEAAQRYRKSSLEEVHHQIQQEPQRDTTPYQSERFQQGGVYHRGEKIAKLIIFELKLAISKLSYLRFS